MTPIDIYGYTMVLYSLACCLIFILHFCKDDIYSQLLSYFKTWG